MTHEHTHVASVGERTMAGELLVPLTPPPSLKNTHVASAMGKRRGKERGGEVCVWGNLEVIWGKLKET